MSTPVAADDGGGVGTANDGEDIGIERGTNRTASSPPIVVATNNANINPPSDCTSEDDTGAAMSATIPPSSRGQQEEEEQTSDYCSRKPKWWKQLSGRRGTRGQRKCIQRMTSRGYCLSKDVLADFSRVNKEGQKSRRGYMNCNYCDGVASVAMVGNDADDDDSADAINEGEHFHNRLDGWRRVWWDRSLGIRRPTSDDENTAKFTAMIEPPSLTSDHNGDIQSGRDKYTHKIEAMRNYKNPIPSKQYEQIWLEIGFGNGDNLLSNANIHSDALFIGCEIYQPGVGTALKQMEEKLSDVSPESSMAFDNVRVIPGDGIKLLYHLPDDYLDVILVTFPDPWPKSSHAHWRVIQREVVREMHRVLANNHVSREKGGKGRVYVATDAPTFDAWTREIFKQESHGEANKCCWNEIVPCPDRSQWLTTVSYYEQKGIDEGRCTMLQCWQSC